MDLSVKVRNITIGEGMPKICVPIVGGSKERILETALKITARPIDMVEWRVDFFDYVMDQKKMAETLKELRKILGEIPLLFTFRTVDEGGNRPIEMKDYVDMNLHAVKTGYIDLVDVEIFRGEAVSAPIVKSAHRHGVKVVGSNHDFEKTPPKNEIVERLQKMQKAGVDITKIAVMPAKRQDVLTLLDATLAMKESFANRPFITMSMGSMGFVSRITGEIFGSAVTFGAVGQVSAPGQIPVEKLEQVLNIIGRYGL